LPRADVIDMVPRDEAEERMDSADTGGDKPRQGDVGGVAAEQLRSIVERIERLEEEKKALAEDIKDVYAEAKGNGFDVKILRKIISRRKRDQADIDEEETILELYLRALGMLPAG
jgi:uncharacterized protein (UPF0335 family)